MNGAELGYWLGVLGAACVTFGVLGLIYWRLREGYRETMERVKREREQEDDQGQGKRQKAKGKRQKA